MTPQKIKQLRDRHGLTQTQLARMAYRSRNTVQNWERNRAPVDPAGYHVALVNIIEGETYHPDTVRDLSDHRDRMRLAGWDV